MANEKRLIYANAVLRCLPWGEVSSHTAQDIADHLADNDVVKVVRCKDCKWYKEGKYLAPNKFCYRLKDRSGEHIGYNFSDDDFCSYGERREGE